VFVSNDPEYQTEEQEGDADLAELDVAEEEIDDCSDLQPLDELYDDEDEDETDDENVCEPKCAPQAKASSSKTKGRTSNVKSKAKTVKSSTPKPVKRLKEKSPNGQLIRIFLF
jgi:hypothetical protein